MDTDKVINRLRKQDSHWKATCSDRYTPLVILEERTLLERISELEAKIQAIQEEHNKYKIALTNISEILPLTHEDAQDMLMIAKEALQD